MTVTEQAILEVSGLSKEYPKFALKDVSFSVRAGSIMGFVGRNGAGKTTTLKSIMNLVHSSSGSIRFFGKELSEHEREIKQQIGYSCGTLSYYPRKKIRDIAEVTASFYENFDAEAYRKYLDAFELDEEKCPAELSEGMKVKLTLALALSHRAKILILDEPTSGLDPFSRDELLDIFRELAAEGVAILFSTHITSDLEKCADAITYIRKGEIVASGEMSDFLAEYRKAPDETLEEILIRLEKEGRHV